MPTGAASPAPDCGVSQSCVLPDPHAAKSALDPAGIMTLPFWLRERADDGNAQKAAVPRLRNDADGGEEFGRHVAIGAAATWLSIF
jgi:hypothetical protein